MMRVLHVLPAIADEFGGPSAYIKGLAANWHEEIELSIVTTAATKDGQLDVPLGVPTTLGNAVCTFFPALRGRYKYSRSLSRYLRSVSNDFDVVHVHALWNHSSAAAVLSRLRDAHSLIVRPLGSLLPWALMRHRLIKRALLNVFWRPVLRRAHVHCMTEMERRAVDVLIKPNSSFVSSIGVDAALLSLPRQTERGLVAFVGRIHPVKNLEALIEAITLLRSRGLPVRLVIAGDGDMNYVRFLRAFANDRKANVEWTGWLGHQEKYRLFQQAGVVACVSFQENFGVSVAEAVAAGVPVVLTDYVGLAAEVRTANVGRVVPPSPESIAAGIEEIIRLGPEEYGRISDEARLFARDFLDWRKICSGLASIYKRIGETT